MSLLNITDLTVHYGKIQALKDIHLNVESGQIVSLVGANGAGKTTLLKTISGLVSASSGSIMFESSDITTLPSNKRVQNGIAQVPEGRGLFGILSVEDNLLLGAYTRRDGKTAADLAKVYDRFGILYEKRHDYAGTLSGGQQQMVAVGRALMSRPRLLLLDEPSMGLAPIIVEDIFSVIHELNEAGTTIFLVEQNARLALKNSHHTYVLENGSITTHGASTDLLNDSAIQAAYLGGS
jgi:branched-chain amino acid transport system ATP-binding protein